MVQEQKAELTIVKNDIQVIRDALTSHVAKEDAVYEIFKRVMNTGVSITGALIALLLAIIGYLLFTLSGCGERKGRSPGGVGDGCFIRRQHRHEAERYDPDICRFVRTAYHSLRQA
jgi:hypothetical protein